MPSELENCMEGLINVFHRYAKDGSLTRQNLRQLMEAELSSFLKVRWDQNVNCAITLRIIYTL